MKLLPYLALLALSLPSVAQEVGTCEPALGEAILETHNVRARVLNNGALFWSGSPSIYEVPKGGGVNAHFSTAFWIGGLVDGQLHTAGSTYGPYEFWAGPLDDAGRPPSDCSPFDRVWSVRRGDIETYARIGLSTIDLREWPTGLGAPTLDADLNLIDLTHMPLSERVDRVIRLEDGETPQMTGDHMLWWIMNDLGGEHERFRISFRDSVDANPIGLEVHGTAFGFESPGALGNTTFYRLKLFKPKGSPMTEAYFGVQQDADLGNFDDDYVGSDTLLGLAYTYNSDNMDGAPGQYGYGEAPPASGLDFFLGPIADIDLLDNDRDGTVDELGERLPMTSFVFYNSGSPITGDVPDAADAYNYMQSIWRDGTLQTWGGFGYKSSSRRAPMSYTGNPPDAWSEFDLGDGTAQSPSDRRFVASAGPFTLGPDQSQELLFGIVTSFGADNLDSVRQLKEDDAFIQNLVDEDLILPSVRPETRTPHFDLSAFLFPTPAQSKVTVRYSIPEPMQVSIRVFDVLGRLRAVLVESDLNAGSFTEDLEVSSWPSGIYTALIRMDHLVESRKIVVAR
jgi:hypothetical protein